MLYSSMSSTKFQLLLMTVSVETLVVYGRIITSLVTTEENALFRAILRDHDGSMTRAKNTLEACFKLHWQTCSSEHGFRIFLLVYHKYINITSFVRSVSDILKLSVVGKVETFL